MKKLLFATALFSIFAVSMISCQIKDEDPAPIVYRDSLTIVSVTPTTGITETSTTFQVEVKYRLESSAQGQLTIAFNNSGNGSTFTRVETASQVVAQGSGTHTFNVTITPKKYTATNTKFAVNVGLANYPHAAVFIPVAGDYQELTVD